MSDDSDLSDVSPSDRRTGERRAVLIPATIHCADGGAFPCILRRMSAGGAKLSIARHHLLPEAFTISVPDHPHD